MFIAYKAQAQTLWPIVGKGAMSIQTQEVFKKLVKDTIIQSDQSITIANMRKSIADTNVILNMAITPGIILVPSDMIIPEPTARSAVPGVSPGRGLLISY